MKLWVGITDDDWFRFLAEIKPDEVNFWQPSGRRTFQFLQLGELFLFEGTRDLMAIYQVQRCAWVNGAQVTCVPVFQRAASTPFEPAA